MSRVRYSYCACCSPSWLWLLLPLWFKFLILSTLLYAFPISSIRQKSASFWKMEDTCREGTTLVLQDKALTRCYLDRKLLDGALCLEANPVVLMLLSVLWKLVPIYRLKKCCHQCSTSSFLFFTLAWHPQLGICRVCVCWRWGCWKSLSLCCLGVWTCSAGIMCFRAGFHVREVLGSLAAEISKVEYSLPEAQLRVSRLAGHWYMGSLRF